MSEKRQQQRLSSAKLLLNSSFLRHRNIFSKSMKQLMCERVTTLSKSSLFEKSLNAEVTPDTRLKEPAVLSPQLPALAGSLYRRLGTSGRACCSRPAKRRRPGHSGCESESPTTDRLVVGRLDQSRTAARPLGHAASDALWFADWTLARAGRRKAICLCNVRLLRAEDTAEQDRDGDQRDTAGAARAEMALVVATQRRACARADERGGFSHAPEAVRLFSKRSGM
jgi:hypothetical protein